MKFVNPDETRSPAQEQVYRQIAERGGCPFCGERFRQTHQKPILLETEHWLVTENMFPYEGAGLHLLLVYKPEHVASFDAVPPAGRLDFFECVSWANREFSIRCGAALIRYGAGGDNGASVEHLHAHLIVGAEKADGGEPLRVKVGYKRKTPG